MITIDGRLVTGDVERELREFLSAKARKREPVVRKIKGVAEAKYVPSSATGFNNFRNALRRNVNWGPASEGLDRLEDSLFKRHQLPLPLPRKVIQNSDKSLMVFWPNMSCRFMTDGFIAMVGGMSGAHYKTIDNTLLDILGFQSKLQRARA